MPREGPFRLTGTEAKAAGACPVNLLEDFYANHWGFGSLYTGFACGGNVATPEDIGCGDYGEEDDAARRDDSGEGWGIPF